MANLPISGLTASASNLVAADLLPVVQTVGVGPVKMTGLQLASGVLSASIVSTISGGGTTTYLRADGTWGTPAGTAAPGGVTGSVQINNAGAFAAPTTALILGGADSAAPSALSVSMPSVVAGTSDTVGAALTIAGSKGTGTGAGGSIIFRVAPAGTTGSAQNALATALTIASDKSATFSGNMLFGTDNTYDIGAAGANRPRNVWVAGIAIIDGSIRLGTSTGPRIYPSGTETVLIKNAGETATISLTTVASNIMQSGAVDVAGSPVAQTLRVQSASGVADTAGANWTLQGSAGTGTGAGGSIIFQVAPASTTASTKNAYATALTIDSTKAATFTGSITASTAVANTSVLASSGYSVTGSSATPMIDLAGTWNTSGAPTGIKLNITDTASAAGSLLMDLQVGGTSKFSVTKTGAIGTSGGYLSILNGFTVLYGGNAVINSFQTQFFQLAPTFQFGWNSATPISGGPDTILTRGGAAATLQLGAADAAAPVAQTLKVQSVVAGTTNTAGANFTIAGSKGTGTGAGGNIIFQVAPAGTTGSAQNALETALTINSAKNCIFGGQVAVGAGGVSAQPSFVSNGSGASGLGFPVNNKTCLNQTSNGTTAWVILNTYGSGFTYNTAGDIFGVWMSGTTGGGALIGSGSALGWTSTAAVYGNAADLILTRAAAATLQFGAVDVAGAPVAQFTRVQSASGVADTAGANWTLQGSAGTGTGAGGSIIFQVAPASTTASTKNAYATALTIDSTKSATFTGQVTSTQVTTTSTTANTSVISSTGYSLTGTSAVNMVDLAGTWNTTGTPTGIKLNITDTASNAASLLLDMQIGGTSKFKVDKAGTITATGGLTLAYVSKTADYTLTSADYCVKCITNAFTITLPSAVTVGAGKMFVVKNLNTPASLNNITIQTTSAQTIDGYAAPGVLNTGHSMVFMSDGANWMIL